MYVKSPHNHGSVPGAPGVTTLSLIASEKRALRALAADGLEPTATNGAAGNCPCAKRWVTG